MFLKDSYQRSRQSRHCDNDHEKRETKTQKRVEAEITAKASMQSNFQMTAEGSFRFGIGEISSGTEFALDQAQESTRVKKDFREAVLKAAQEYKQEPGSAGPWSVKPGPGWARPSPTWYRPCAAASGC